jgi:tetratricopeptide (TPR) repeat protein
MAGTVLESALGIFGTVIRYRDSRNFPETFFSNLLSEAMGNQGKGEKSWQRVRHLVEALLDYKLNNRNDISYLRADWKGDTTDLQVTATLEALRHLLKDIESFKPTEKTSEAQVKKYIGEALTDYLRDVLKILEDNRPENARRGTSNWVFTLKLWSQKDKAKNLQKLAEVWGVNGEPGISSQINRGQNTDGKSENDDVPADAPPDKPIKVAFSQLPDSIPVWKGRDELVENLTAKLVQMLPDGTSPPKVLAIIGQGGMGKTSVAIKLVEGLGVNWQQSVSQAGKSLLAGGYECVMYFKALEGTSFDDVAGFLLSEGLGIQGAAELKKPEEKIAKIMVGLQQTRCLLVLDNLEPILHPAVEAENPDCLDSPQVHRAISPDWGKLLNALVYQQHQSQMILTSREVPGDLADTRYPGSAPDSELVQIEVLQGVDVAAGVEILRQRQLTDKLADLQWISQRVEGHVVLFTLLASLGKGRPGYLRKHPELVTKNAELILQEQMARQSAAARDLLRRMCVLRVPIDVRGLTFLRLYTDDWEQEQRLMIAAQSNKPVEFTEEEISETEKILKPLVDSCLVESSYDPNKCENFYYIKQLTAEFLLKKYEELPNLFKRVYSFDISSIKFEDFQEATDLQVLVEPIMFASNVGDEREQSKLGNVFFNYALRLGHGTAIENAIMQHPSIIEDNNQASALLGIGSFHLDLGNWDEAERCFQQALAIARKENNQSDIASSLGLLGGIERNRGNWDEAEKLFRQFLALRTELGARQGMAYSWGALGDLERNRGNWDEAEKLFRQCLEVETELGDRSGMASSWGMLGYIEQCRGNWDAAEKLYRQSLALRTELGDRQGMAYSWGVLGDLERNRDNWDEAEKLYRQALALRTELGDRQGMATSIGCLGDNELGRGNLDTAEQLLTEALGKMQKLGMTLQIAEVNYDLARLERKRGNTEVAQQHYDTAHQILQQLGAAKDLERIDREWHKSD